MQEILRRFTYTKLVEFAQRLTGIRPHYKAQYSALYLQGVRWFVLRNLRLWWDGWSCVRCGNRYPLQVHHTSYTHKGKGSGINEFLDLSTLCDDCHAWTHGKGER